MRSAFGRAVVVAGAVVMALGSAAGTAAAKPRPPVLTFSPAPYNYGQVAAGGAASQTFTLANAGGQGTGRLRVTLAGAAAFTITGDTCHSLAPGKRCTVTVRFTPVTSGIVTATLTAAGKKRGATAAADVLTGAGRGLGLDLEHIYWAGTSQTISSANLDGSDPQTLVSGQNGPIGVAVDASHLYWTNQNDGSIWAANRDGTSPHVISSAGLAGWDIAVGGGHLYWTVLGRPPSGGAIWEANLDGSDPHAIVTGQAAPVGIAVNSGSIYWSTTGDNSAGAGEIWQANLDGSSPHAIITGQFEPFGVAVNSGNLFWTAAHGSAAGAGEIWQASLDGSSPHAIVAGQDAPFGVAADGSHVYWTNELGGTVSEANLDGTDPRSIVTTGVNQPLMMAVAPPAAPALSFTPAPFDYGQASTGQAIAQTFTLANSGGTATGALTDKLTGAAAFTVTGDTCTGISLAAGGTCTITVRFAPSSMAASTATLTAASVNPGVTATDVLTGTGVTHPRFLYWTDQFGTDQGTIKEFPLTGTGTPTTLVTGQLSPAGMAVDASHIYWATAAAPGIHALIQEAPLTGSPPTVLIDDPELESPAGVAVDASHIYWADSASGIVYERKLTGGLIVPFNLSNPFTAPAGVAVDSTHVYWADSGTGTIMEARLNPLGPATTLVSGQSSPWGVAVDSGHIYWTNSGDGTIKEAPLTGGPVTTLVTGQDNPEGLAVDSGHLYWANNDISGTINEAPLTGGPVTTLVTGQISPVGVAVSP